jgi:hypothetical protein
MQLPKAFSCPKRSQEIPVRITTMKCASRKRGNSHAVRIKSIRNIWQESKNTARNGNELSETIMG